MKCGEIIDTVIAEEEERKVKRVKSYIASTLRLLDRRRERLAGKQKEAEKLEGLVHKAESKLADIRALTVDEVIEKYLDDYDDEDEDDDYYPKPKKKLARKK